MKKIALILIPVILISVFSGCTIFDSNGGIFSDDAENFVDTDDDGVPDDKDAFIFDPAASVDTDGDGYPDRWNPGKTQQDSNSDPPLELDEFAYDPNEWKDTDRDKVGDNSDVFPNDPNEWSDLDKDGIGDNADINPLVDLKIDIKLEKIKVTSRVDLLRWAQIYFEVHIDGTKIETLDNNGKYWKVLLNQEKKISHEVITYDIPDKTEEPFCEIEIIMYDNDLFTSDDVVDINNKGSEESLILTLDKTENTISSNDLTIGRQAMLWYNISLPVSETPDIKMYNRTYRWNFNGKPVKLSMSIPVNTYKNYLDSKVDRSPQSNIHPDDAMRAFVTSNEKVINDLASDLKSYAKNYDSVTTANFILRFVQGSIVYRLDNVSKGPIEYWRFPVETLVDRQGDCEDTAVLYAAIMEALNYEAALIFCSWEEDGEKVGHLAVGIHLEGDHGDYVEDSAGKKYYFCETTAASYNLGQLPKDFDCEPEKIIVI